jgi:ferrous iron transport protein A
MKDTLCNLPIGACARVEHIELDNAVSQRLLTLGLLPGMDVKVVQHAPLGDPIAIEFEGRRVSLRKQEAAGVILKALPN